MKKEISIDPILKEKCPNLVLGGLSCTVEWAAKNASLQAKIQATCQTLATELSNPAIRELEAIASSRLAYKTLGKDPSRYRLSAEALLRRVVNGKGLYEVNTIVDCLNLISIQSAYSIGGYDLAKIEGDIVLGIGAEKEPYTAIGRGELNIANLPIFRDEKGAFGSPTSDSTRTMVQEKTQQFLMLFFNFGGHHNLQKVLEETQQLYKTYTAATDFEMFFID